MSLFRTRKVSLLNTQKVLNVRFPTFLLSAFRRAVMSKVTSSNLNIDDP